MDYKKIEETLEKQLQILSERSIDAADNELQGLTNAICQTAEAIIRFHHCMQS